MRENNKHMVLDADGLYIVTKNLDLVKGYKNCILTPNKNEFARLAKELDVNLEDKDRFDPCRLLLLGHLPRPMQTISAVFRAAYHELSRRRQLCAKHMGLSVYYRDCQSAVCRSFLLAACSLQTPKSCTQTLTLEIKASPLSSHVKQLLVLPTVDQHVLMFYMYMHHCLANTSGVAVSSTLWGNGSMTCQQALTI